MKGKNVILYGGGLIFGFGLALSGMTKPEVVLSFLQLKNLGLLFVLGCGALIPGIAFQYLSRTKKKAPLTHLPYGLRQYPLDKNIIYGGIIFGIGWGISGMCPGAAYASLGVGNWPILFGLFGMLIGAFVFARFFKK